jgi:hypothetical protein|tara:strand:+ start:12450 stop:14273 length:1824 start_codon:yes stop_codon:yes gene_type:complete
MKYSLFPRPQSVRIEADRINLGKHPWVRIDADISATLKHRLIAFTERLNPTAKLQITFGNHQRRGVFLDILPIDSKVAPQGYQLICRQKGVTLTAGDEAGVFYGLQTLAQLVEQCGPRLPKFRIEDRPDIEHRGVMLDISRCKVPRLESLFTYVEKLARLKLNQLQLYTEHTFAFANHEVVWRDASPFTPQELIQLDRFCSERFIELVPNLNSFGHFERWLRHAEYHSYAECPEGFKHPFGGETKWGSTLKPNRQSLALLSELFDEYLPNFSSGRFNIGCDETWELGQGWSKRRCASKGATQVYLDFLNKIHRQVQRRDRQTMFWGDIVLQQPDSLRQLSKEMTALNWGYEANHPFSKECQQLASSGLPFYVCPGTSSWNSLTGRTLNAQKNLANAARSATKFGARGFLITDWGDGGHHQYQPVSYLGILSGACFAWATRANSSIDPVEGVNRVFFADSAGRTGRICWELGKVLELAPSRIRNATIFNQLLFWDMQSSPTYMNGITTAQLKKCLRKLSSLDTQLQRADPGCDDGAMVKAELHNAIAMASHGVDRYLIYHGKIRSKKPVADLRRIISRHDELWLARNRPGGLKESSARLQASLSSLRA